MTATLAKTTLRPGLLVSLKTTVRGNVTYRRRDLENKKLANGAHRKKIETVRDILDLEEHETAIQVRGKAVSLIRAVCSASAFGLLCPETASDALTDAVAEARKLTEEFNDTARVTRIGVYIITGRIAPDDVEAVRAINSEVRELLADMEEGLKNLDVKSVRAAASKAKGIGQMLSLDAQARVQIAITAARKTARKMSAAGEQAAAEIDRQTIATLTEARTSFLDIDLPTREIAAPVVGGRAVDLQPARAVKKTSAPVRGVDVARAPAKPTASRRAAARRVDL